MKKKVLKPKVVGNRGKAIPLGDNFYYMQGPKHSEGGIPIGKNPKTGIEVEGEEVMHISPKEVKVFSSVPFLNGESPAEKVLGGEEPNKVFKQQENFKDRNKIKDDGTKKKAMGGKDDPSNITNRLRNNIKSNVSRSERLGRDIKNVYNKFIKPVALTYSALEGGRIVGNTLLNIGAKGIYGAGKALYNSGKVAAGTQISKAANNLGKFTVKNTRGASYKAANRVNSAIDIIDGNYKDAGAGVVGDAVINRLPGHKYIKYITKPTIDNVLNVVNKDKKVMGGISKNKTSRDKFEHGGKPNGKKKEDYLPSTGELTRDTQLVTARAAEIGRVTTPNHYKLADTGNRTPSKIEHTTGDKIKSFAVRTLSETGPNALSDIAGTGANVIGAIKGYKTNKKMLSKLKYSKAPTPRQAAKLKTKININPQLDKMRESVAAYERDVNANTASSRVGLQRKQLARMAGILQTNELYGNKENMETQLINKDKLNQQAVADRNVTEYNQWARGKADFNNNIANLKAENKVSYLNNLTNSVQDLIARGDLRRKEDLDRKLIGLANPHGEAVVDGNEVFKRGSKKKK